MTIKLGRDPFARRTIRKRRSYYLVGMGCDYCGQHKLFKGAKYLYRYYVEHDENRPDSDVPGLFCDINCCNAYHS